MYRFYSPFSKVCFFLTLFVYLSIYCFIHAIRTYLNVHRSSAIHDNILSLLDIYVCKHFDFFVCMLISLLCLYAYFITLFVCLFHYFVCMLISLLCLYAYFIALSIATTSLPSIAVFVVLSSWFGFLPPNALVIAKAGGDFCEDYLFLLRPV